MNGGRTLPALGQQLELSAPDSLHIWQQDLDAETFDYLADHRLDGTVVLPGTAYVDWMLAAAREALGSGPNSLSEVRLEQMLALPAAGARQVQVVLQSEAAGQASVRVSSRLLHSDATSGTASPWMLHARGVVQKDLETSANLNAANFSVSEVLARCSNVLTGAGFYAALADHGLEYGPSFQRVIEIHHRSGEALARLDPAMASSEEMHVVDPALLDACFQILGATLPPEVPRPICQLGWTVCGSLRHSATRAGCTYVCSTTQVHQRLKVT